MNINFFTRKSARKLRKNLSVLSLVKNFTGALLFFACAALSAAPMPEKEFVLFTMPKTGTHLLTPFLEMLTGRTHVGETLYNNLHTLEDYDLYIRELSQPNVVQVHWWLSPVTSQRFSASLDQIYANEEFLLSHAPYSPEMEQLLTERNCVVFHVMRDPRDYAVSMLNYVRKTPNKLYSDPKFRAASKSAQLFYVINGTDWYNSTHTVVNCFNGWLSSPIVCVLHFEKLMGPQGGSYTVKEQLAELRKIPRALKMQVSDERLLDLFHSVYGTGKTFHKGLVGTWKEYFKEEHKRTFKELLGAQLISLGYEKDYNW